MARKKKQLSLPGFKEQEAFRYPQPRVRKFRDIKRYEIAYRPFDLRFRGSLSKWLDYLKGVRKIAYEKTLDDFELKLVSLYLYPQGKERKWLSQKEVAGKIKGIKKRKVRPTLVAILLKVWGRARA